MIRFIAFFCISLLSFLPKAKAGDPAVYNITIRLFETDSLPVNAGGVVLVLLGIAFMASETFIPAFGILAIGGLLTFGLGASILFDGDTIPGLSLDWSIITSIILLGVLLITVITVLLARTIKERVSTGTESMIAESAEIIEWHERQGRVRVQGEIWKAISDKEKDLKPGDKVTVESVENLLVKII